MNLHFTPSFYKKIIGVQSTYADIQSIDEDQYRGWNEILSKNVSGFGLSFVAAYEDELKSGGANRDVTEENKKEYIDLIAEHRKNADTADYKI